MKTRWTDKIDLVLPHNEYPRPQMARDLWQNLNGRFQYAITDFTYKIPDEFDGNITVPFAVESELSGVGKRVSANQILWYKKEFSVNPEFSGKRVLLHFDAVDWYSIVYLNGKKLGEHKGGYMPFSFDITDYICDVNTLILRVYDPTDSGMQPRGKQSEKSHGFWYTSTTGIWKTVWLECVDDVYIKNIKILPDIDSQCVSIATELSSSAEIEAVVKEGEKTVFEGKISDNEKIKIENCRLWSPEDPFLYDVEIKIFEGGKCTDKVKSYFGMRKYSIGKDVDGLPRLMLNNKPYFQRGLLDQGYWCDGGLTPPCDEAVVFDIQSMKDLGFNMLRKHIKIESARWYYHCDRLGMIVWQDMVSGIDKLNMTVVGALPNIGVTRLKDDNYAFFGRTDKRFRDDYEKELHEMIDYLYNCTCIGCWVPFNEAWGQFDAKRIGEEVKAHDPSRIVDHASGWHDQSGPELKSVHRYVVPVTLPKADGRPFVLSEYGGLSYIIPEHSFNAQKSFGYNINYKSKEKLTEAYRKMHEKQIIPLVKKGLCATVYTQLSDVEFEINGMFTYDREVLKIDSQTVKDINSKLVL